ncbi:unnamed protein product [Caenorhabditis auriculariae]|uniref:non-specific protein-tyrosine kinase n=1 Tax=Caenorhabditis auriculariae TaxID=2777116 RepID=A0A8S1H139_9PELO|nr:unnamed protein product [Caenorhabditis auriculariae]
MTKPSRRIPGANLSAAGANLSLEMQMKLEFGKVAHEVLRNLKRAVHQRVMKNVINFGREQLLECVRSLAADLFTFVDAQHYKRLSRCLEHYQRKQMSQGALVESSVLDVLQKTQLLQYQDLFVFGFQVRRLEHFHAIKPRDMATAGLHQDQIKRLLEASKIVMQDSKTDKNDCKYVSQKSAIDQIVPTQETSIPADQIKLFEQLGEGTFAVVKRGTWTYPGGRKLDVAVKILRDISPTVLEDLKVEASHLLKLQHPYLIRLYGIVQRPSMMIFELCEGGSLLDRLRDDHKKAPFVTQLLEYCMQTVKALQFLEVKHCVHRDVAARNILLTKDEMSVKLSDFGLMRNLKENEQMYIMGPQKKVPFSWCPPESLRHRKFSHASDVWAYGVLMWEIFTLGEEPWIGCRAIDVLKRLDAGERLEEPQYGSKKLYEIMNSCWKLRAEDRPKFNTLRANLKAIEFNTAVVREPHVARNPKTSLIGGHEWFGQSKVSREFGKFPREIVFVPSQSREVPDPVAQLKSPQTNKALPAISVNSQNAGSFKISLPVQGSFIHVGHGDGLGGQSWGDPAVIDSVYLKNPVVGKPLSSAQNGALVVKSILPDRQANDCPSFRPSLNSDALKIGSAVTVHAAWDDDFETAQSENFSPSHIEIPRDLERSNSNGISFVSNGKTEIVLSAKEPVLLPTRNVAPISSFANNSSFMSPSYVPKSVLITPSTTGTADIPLPPHFTSYKTKSTVQTNKDANFLTSTNNDKPRIGNQIFENRVLQPTPVILPPPNARNNASVALSTQNQFPIGTSNNKDNVILRPTNSASQPPIHISRSSTAFSEHQSLSQPVSTTQRPVSSIGIPLVGLQNGPATLTTKKPSECLIPSKVQPTTTMTANINKEAKTSTTFSNGRSDFTEKLERNNGKSAESSTNHRSTNSNSQALSLSSSGKPNQDSGTKPSAVEKPQSSNLSAPSNTSRQSSQNPEPPNTAMDRLSKINAEISSLLPPPSKLLFGNSSSSKTNAKISNPVNTERTSSLSTVPKPGEITTTAPIKKPEPVLPTAPLQPILLHNNQAKPFTQSTTFNQVPKTRVTPPPQPAPIVRPEVQQAVMPFYNLMNSSNPSYNAYSTGSIYPSFGGYGQSSYPMPYQPMSYTPSMYPGYGYSMTPNASRNMANVPAPSRNDTPPDLRPLAESDINELLQPSSFVSYRPVSQSGSSASAGNTNSFEAMEVLYREANFASRSSCDAMVIECHGNTEEALRKLKVNQLVNMGIATDVVSSKSALERNNFELNAAANFLLGM